MTVGGVPIAAVVQLGCIKDFSLEITDMYGADEDGSETEDTGLEINLVSVSLHIACVASSNCQHDSPQNNIASTQWLGIGKEPLGMKAVRYLQVTFPRSFEPVGPTSKGFRKSAYGTSAVRLTGHVIN